MKNAPLTSLVEQTILDQMRAKASFTALDVSNRLKADRYPVAHREVAATVREIYDSGAMAYFDYERELIPVVTEGGGKQAKAFLYHFQQVRPRTYQTRDLAALPPVPAETARDLADCVPASPLPLLPRSARPSSTRTRHSRTRRDGALSVPRSLLLQLGWQDGQRLSLTADVGELSLAPAGSDSDTTLRVWSGSRLRVCRTKLCAATLSAKNVTLIVESNELKVQTTIG